MKAAINQSLVYNLLFTLLFGPCSSLIYDGKYNNDCKNNNCNKQEDQSCNIDDVRIDSESNNRPIIAINDGQIRGFTMESTTGRKYYAFTSIPYAKPPLGELRFEKPSPVEGWSGIHEGPRDLPNCVQFQALHPFMQNITYGDEDCLYLSVYTPMIGKKHRLPVMLYVLGGAWRSEFPPVGQADRSKYMMDEDVVLVMFKYRVGALGFLSLENDIMPGNQGMKDQAMAVKWITDNIASFGGDPKRITLFGNSVGAASVHYLMISPMTKHLVQGGILQSGQATALWGLTSPGLAKYRARRIAEHLHCPTESEHRMISCLKDRTAVQITDAERIFISRDFDPPVPFMPIVESGPDSFITASPFNTPVEKPWIIGVNRNEGAFKTAFYKFRPELMDSFKERGSDFLPEALQFTNTTSQPKHISNEIINKYKSLSLTEIWTDGLFFGGTIAAKKLSRSHLYFYFFNHRGKTSMTDLLASEGNVDLGDMGVCHTDELLYLFNYEDDLKAQKTEKDRQVSKRLIKLWTNFAKFGKPTEDGKDWPEYNEETKEHLTIGTDGDKVESNLWPDRVEFWSNLPIRDLMERKGL